MPDKREDLFRTVLESLPSGNLLSKEEELMRSALENLPDGIKGEEMPAGSYILALADSFNAMTSSRPYRKAMALETAAQEIESQLGKMYEPKLGQIFLDLFRSGSLG